MKNTLLSAAVLLNAAIWGVTTAQAQMVPAGAPIRVRTIDPISVDTAKPGATFRGSLADPVKTANGAILIPRGAPVRLSVVNARRSGRLRGRDRIAVKVDSITFRGRTFPVVSTVAESRGGRRGARTLRRTGIGAGAGALVGGLVGGGGGAAVGALVGGGGGTAVAAATGGRHLTIPSESVLSFKLQSPLRVK